MPDVASLIEQCPTLACLAPAERTRVAQEAMTMSAPAGVTLFDIGQACQALPLVLSGSIRVFKRAENGREISLYRVRPGELCLVTVGCLLGSDAYPATGISESEIRAIALPRALFLHLTESHPPFRQAVFHLFSERLTGLMQLVEEITFRKLDQRLATLLAARAPLVQDSHQQLADELGSVREIVSRLLKGFAAQGLVSLGREQLNIVDRNGLQKIAAM